MDSNEKATSKSPFQPKGRLNKADTYQSQGPNKGNVLARPTDARPSRVQSVQSVPSGSRDSAPGGKHAEAQKDHERGTSCGEHPPSTTDAQNPRSARVSWQAVYPTQGGSSPCRNSSKGASQIRIGLGSATKPNCSRIIGHILPSFR